MTMDPGRYRRGDYRCPRVFGGWTSVSQVCDATGVYERLEYQFLSKRQAIIVRRKLRSRETRCGHRWVEFGRRSSSEADGGSTRIRAATSMPNLHLQPMKVALLVGIVDVYIMRVLAVICVATVPFIGASGMCVCLSECVNLTYYTCCHVSEHLLPAMDVRMHAHLLDGVLR